jgi:hypothetical protein
MKNRNIAFTTLLLFALGSVALSPLAKAAGPDTEGAIAGANNGEGIGVLVSRTTGIWNTGTGFEALNHLTAGNQNTATGVRALFSDINGGFNTATGVFSLFSNTSGFFNTATGAYSLASNTVGSSNTANGYAALNHNTEGEDNTATGFGALFKNTTGGGNTANGSVTLNQNTTGSINTAIGNSALFSNTEGSENTAVGSRALDFNTTGNQNTAVGRLALDDNTDGSVNTAIGMSSLRRNTTGDANTAIGNRALVNNTTGDANTAIGDTAGFDLSADSSGNVCIGQNVFGVAGESNRTWIRNINTTVQSFSAGVNNYVTVRLSDGRLGQTAVVSSRRYKEDIKPMDKTSQALYGLKPVTFRLKKKFDPTQAPGFGLIAEEVEKVDPDLVYRNEKGEVESVRYEMVNAMLLNEFLKEHRRVEEQGRKAQEQEATIAQQRKDFQAKIGKLEATIAQQQKGMDILTAHLKEQAAQIQKVSARVEASGPAPQVVANQQ